MEHILSMTMVDRLIGSAPFLYEGDFAAGIRRAAALGYTGVEMHATNPCGVDIPALQGALRETGLRMTAMGTGRAYVNEGLSISDPNGAVRTAAVERLRDFIRTAGEFGSLLIVGCMRGNIRTPEELPETLERLGESMLQVDAFADSAGVTVVFEPINRYENNFLCSAGEICDFIHRYGLQHTKVMLDTFHMNLEEADMAQTIYACGEDLAYVHIADSNRLYPGGGHIPFAQLLDAFEKAGYRGAYSAECLPLPNKEAAQERWLAAMRALLGG